MLFAFVLHGVCLTRENTGNEPTQVVKVVPSTITLVYDIELCSMLLWTIM